MFTTCGPATGVRALSPSSLPLQPLLGATNDRQSARQPVTETTDPPGRTAPTPGRVARPYDSERRRANTPNRRTHLQGVAPCWAPTRGQTSPAVGPSSPAASSPFYLFRRSSGARTRHDAIPCDAVRAPARSPLSRRAWRARRLRARSKRRSNRMGWSRARQPGPGKKRPPRRQARSSVGPARPAVSATPTGSADIPIRARWKPALARAVSRAVKRER